jgi:hypothetical protein
MLFDVVIPTYYRQEKLEKCLTSIQASVGVRDEIRVFVYCDNGYRLGHGFKERITTDQSFKVIVEGMAGQNKAFGIWNAHYFGWSPDGMFYVCDDVELEPDCLATAITIFKDRFPDTDGVVGLNQQNIPAGQEGFSQSAMGLIGMGFSRRYPGGRCFCPDYSSFHADAELGLFARECGRFVFAGDARLTHHHPAHGGEADETHAVVRVPAVVQKDRDVWNNRQAAGYLWGRNFKLVGRG